LQIFVVLQVLDFQIIATLSHCAIQNLESVIYTCINEVLVDNLISSFSIFISSSSFIQLVFMIVDGLLNITLLNEVVVNIL
jgi:hypothetical protein